MNDPTVTRQRMQELHEALRKFDSHLHDNFQRLDNSWHRLDKAWDGQAYQEFNGSWDKSRRTMLQYIELSKKYETFLQKLIETLREFEKPSGL
jgi:uncharacterized protein YukE